MRWALSDYSTAAYRRTVQRTAKVLDPADWKAASLPAAKPRPVAAKNLIQNGSFEKLAGAKPRSWTSIQFAGQASLKIDRKRGRTGKHSVTISSKPGSDCAWMSTVDVQRNTRYRLSGWIRTKDVARGAGAQLHIHELGREVVSPTVAGTEDWTRVQVEFNSGKHAKVQVACLFGGFRKSRGQAWFDDLELVRVAEPAPEFAERIERALFKGVRRPPHLLGKELDAKSQVVKTPFRDLRDLPAFLAFDLRRANRYAKLRRQTVTVANFAPLWLDVTYQTVADDGTQRIEARLRKALRQRPARAPRAPAKPSRKPRGKGKAASKPAAAKPRPPLAIGTIVIQRRVDPKNHRVESFTSDMQLIFDLRAPNKALPRVKQCSLGLRESWTFRRQLEPNDATFQARVHEAIAKGARYLRGEAGRRGLAPGHLALVILTLLKAGEDPRDPLMRKLLDRLRRMTSQRTYELSVAIMAIEALYAPANERDLLISGRIDRPMERKPNPEDKALLEKWVEILLENVDLRVELAYVQRWNYTPAPRYDNSCTQYAMLGLYTASLCGVEISPQVWLASANHWLESQTDPDGASELLQLVSYPEMNRAKNRGGRPRRTGSRGIPVRARGWAYTGRNRRSATGSMTTAGITGLVICEAALRQQKKGTKRLRSRVQDAMKSGFAWLARNFTITKNPPKANRHDYYYLYGLERACELNGTAMINGRRWYFEGAEYLLGKQGKHGPWANLLDTCFAILFLKKAAPPVITGDR